MIFKNGWIGYEFRRGEEIINYYEKLGIEKKMIWDGKQFEGNLIIHAEQGLGEEILFSSMFEELLNYPSNLYVSASIRLRDLFRRSFPQINFIKKNDNFKFKQDTKHLLAGSLGKFFRNSINDFKNNKRSWLIPNNQRVKEFSNFFNNCKKIKVGLAWKSAGIEADTRNIYLEDLAKIFSKDKFEIINLQYGDIQSDRQTYEQKESRKLIYFENLDYTNDLEGLVALIFNCDLVVTIGGFTASLAGSLGISSWVLPPASTTWCWHSNSNRIESLWYPKMKFFRQKKINEWEYVFNLIKNEIKLKFY